MTHEPWRPRVPCSDLRRLVLALMLFAMPRLAHANLGTVIVGGTADEAARQTVSAAVEKTARESGWSIAPAISPRDRDALLKCKDPAWTPCVPATFQSAGIERVFLVIVNAGSSKEGGRPIYTLDGRLILATGATFNRRHCEHCADDALATEAATLARDLLRSNATQSGHTVVEITSKPPGAQIVLDGNPIGATDGKFNTFPGPHIVVFEKEGYESTTVEFVVEEGKTAYVTTELKATNVRTPIVPVERRSRAVPFALMGGGAVLLGVGAVSLWRGIADDERYEYPRALPVGVVASLGGAAAIAVGVYMYRRASRTDGHVSTPNGLITRDAFVVGWTRTF